MNVLSTCRYHHVYWSKDKVKHGIMYLSQQLEKIAGGELSLLEVSLRWLRHHSKLSDHDAIILGFSKLKHFEVNLGLMNKGPLSNDVLQLLDEAWDNVNTKCPKYHR